MIKGCIDKLERDFVHGWAVDTSEATQKLVIKVFYFDDEIGAGLANLKRTDLINIEGTGEISFSIKIPQIDHIENINIFVQTLDNNLYKLPYNKPLTDIFNSLNYIKMNAGCTSSDFDAYFYKQKYNKLDLTDMQAATYFYHTGQHEGEIGHPLCNSNVFSLYFNKWRDEQNSLEIGPGANPRLFGRNVYYFDIRTPEELIEWAKTRNLNVDHVPEKIDFIDKHGDLSMINKKFKLIFSSHNLEHSVDFINYLNTIYDLLEDDGVFACIVPDKRYTFDYFRPLSQIEDIIEQNYRKELKHPMRTFLETTLLYTHNNPFEHWKNNHGEPHSSNNSLELINEINSYESSEYIDLHRWVFSYHHFAKICNQLYSQNFIKLKLDKIYNVERNSCSFNAIFIK